MFTQSQSYNWPFEGHCNADVALGENELPHSLMAEKSYYAS